MDVSQLAPGISFAVTDRLGGVSPAPYDGRNLGGLTGDDYANVLHNRQLTADQLGVSPDRVVFMHQVHSATVARVSAPFTGEAPDLDGVWTTEPGLALASLGADCAAVLLADPVARVVGAAHSGRAGTLSGIATHLVEAMATGGADPSRMVAYIGPAACGRCYEVPEAMRAESAAAVPETFATTSWGTPSLDLPAGITAQLAKAGLTDIRRDPRCTIETAELYSHRRDAPTGRFAAYLWLS
jgi:YfiH family protein